MVKWSTTWAWTRSGGSKLELHTVSAHLQQKVEIESALRVPQ